MYPDLLADLEKAERFIFLEFFIVRTGKMWKGVEDILVRKAAQGVDVRLIYDDFGSLLGLPSDFVVKMERAHIRCIPFNPVVPLVSLVMNHRDHRKIVVVDGNTAYTGGINLADEYINEEERFGYWKDAALRTEGAAVWNFTVMFLDHWNAFRPSEEDYMPFMPQAVSLPAQSDGVIQPYGDSPLDEEALAETVYLNIINQAQRYVYIYTPILRGGRDHAGSAESGGKAGRGRPAGAAGHPGQEAGLPADPLLLCAAAPGGGCASTSSRPAFSTPSATSATTAPPWWAASTWITAASSSTLSAGRCCSITVRSLLCGTMCSAPCQSAGRCSWPTAAPRWPGRCWTVCSAC